MTDLQAEPEHECPTCHKKYHTKPVLKQHMLIHGEKKFLCSDCGKSFYSKATLLAHSKVGIIFFVLLSQILRNILGAYWSTALQLQSLWEIV